MKLAITQMALGVLVTVSAFIVITKGFPTQFTLPADGNGTMTVVEVYPHLTIANVSVWLALAFGLAVLGCGIAQFLKARGLKGAKPL